METKEIFKRLGLPKHSNVIYELLRRGGPMIATRLCESENLHRPAAYRALASLLARHFVFTTQMGRRKLYHAAKPSLIANAFTQTSANISDRMAKLAVADDQYKQKEIRFLSGFKGIQAAFDDVITHMNRGGTFYRYTSEKDLDAVNKYLSKNYRAMRDQKKLERMVISNPISGMRKKPRLERFVKYIPPEIDLFDQNIIQLVYGDRLSFIDLNTERVLIIENKPLADFQKVIFKQLYGKLPLPQSSLRPATGKAPVT
jgi:sugar-specific transcriptional regulator TrmB